MPKLSGLGMEMYFCGFDLSGCTGSIDDLSTPRTTLEVTGLNKSSTERIYGHSSGQASLTTYFNDAAGKEHLAYRGLPTTDVLASVLVRACAGSEAATMRAKQINYDWSRPLDGSLTGNIQLQSNSSFLEWGEVLVTRTSVTGAGNSPSLNNSAASCNGVSVTLHVACFCGCTLCVALQSSSDDGCADAFAAISCFTQVTCSDANVAERKTVAGAVEQYLRLNYSGTFTSAIVVATVRRGDSTDIEAYTTG